MVTAAVRLLAGDDEGSGAYQLPREGAQTQSAILRYTGPNGALLPDVCLRPVDGFLYSARDRERQCVSRVSERCERRRRALRPTERVGRRLYRERRDRGRRLRRRALPGDGG